MSAYLNANWPPLALLVVMAIIASALWLSEAGKRRASRRALVLDVVAAQQPDGTGYTLTQEVAKRAGFYGPLVEIYSHLGVLQREGIVSSRWGTASRPGGPRHRHYWITADHPDLTHDGDRP